MYSYKYMHDNLHMTTLKPNPQCVVFLSIQSIPREFATEQKALFAIGRDREDGANNHNDVRG
jgi:hypothetical protein